MKRKKSAVALVVALLCGVILLPVLSGNANATLIRVSQESSADAGDFNANILGYIDPYTSGLTAAGYYSYGTPLAASYNGSDPLAESETALMFFLAGADGLSMFMVYDATDSTGGNAKMEYAIVNDTVAALVKDDSGEAVTVTGGTSVVTSHGWAGGYTDGYVLGALDGPWTLFSEFTAAPTNLDTWKVKSIDGSAITFDMTTGRRVRFDAVPEPATLVMLGAGLVGLVGLRRKKRA